jgi:hypothetical protein
MPNRPPQRDPEAAWVRKTTAARRVGADAKCSNCNETRPEALIRKSKPKVCHECKRKAKGKTTTDEHHFGAEANSPITIPVPVNDHRAELSVAQYDWPKKTRENPDGSPLLAAAGCLRGFIDSIHYLMTKGLVWVADMLEAADAFLANKLGPKWWIGTELEKFAPEQKHKPRSPRESK